MKFCNEKIQNHLINGGNIKRNSYSSKWSFSPVKLDDEEILIFADTKELYYISKADLVSDDWEIVESEYDFDKIIKDKILCAFSNKVDFKCFNISTLSEINKSNKITYFSNEGLWYQYCKPFNPAEFNVAENLRDYEK